jgi:hypothetical protein
MLPPGEARTDVLIKEGCTQTVWITSREAWAQQKCLQTRPTLGLEGAAGE